MKKYILPIITLIITILTIISTIKLNILPNKYLILFITIELILFILSLIQLLKNKILKIIGIILSIIIIIINLIGVYYTNKTDNFIKNIFTKEIKYTSIYYLITNKENNSNIEDLDETTNILYYEYSKNIDKAKEILGNYKYQKTNNIIETLTNLNTYLLVDKTNYEITDINKENLKIIYEFNVETTEKRVVNKKQDSYNIYIGGRDFTKELTDFNMLITINNKTKTILLTSIPRDYYLNIPNYKQDSLEFMGLLGENVIMSSLENLFDTEINYYGSLYTDGLVEVVDKLGGIEFCSDQTFTTTHALVQDTYKDYGEKLTITKGCHHLNGIETLTVARERKHVGSDRKRQENCRQIFKSIMNKSLSTTTLTNYEELLNSVSNLYQTNMDEKTFTTLIKNLINDKYTILEQSVDGSDGENYIRQGTVKSYVMYPYENSVNNAKQKIKEVLEG